MSEQSLWVWVGQMGVMGWPLVLSSVLALALILEKLWLFVRVPELSDERIQGYVQEAYRTYEGHMDMTDFAQNMADTDVRQGITALFIHARRHKTLREEVARLWLQEQQHRMRSRLKFLSVIGVITPMMGLLGTVLGLIAMFGTLSGTQDSVTPALLATGLHQAMYTTAAGLCIAIPALAAAHLLGLWASHYINRLTRVLNQVNLLIEGVPMCGYTSTHLQAAVA